MMSQSEDNSSFNLWVNNDVWNHPTSNEYDKCDLWSQQSNQEPTTSSFSNVNGVVPVTLKDTDESFDGDKRTDFMNSVPPWAAVESVLSEVDIPLIWSTPKLFPCNDQNLSLSGPDATWPAGSSDTAADSAAPELWDSSHSSLLFGMAGMNSENWKIGQSVQEYPSSSTHVMPGVNSTFPSTASDMTSFSSPCFTAPSTSIPNACPEVASSTKNPGSTDESLSMTAFSTEQLCDHLINSNDGWGRRPIDQRTPWDFSDVNKGVEQPGRSGLTTPTPGVRSVGLTPPFRAAHTVESNVWTSDPPTGTGIWEMHYENCGARGSMWTAPVHSAPNSVIPSTTAPVVPNQIIPFNNMSSGTTDRNTAHLSNPLQNRPGVHRSWDANEKFWPNSNSASGTGRPLLGSARGTVPICAPVDDAPFLCNDSNSVSAGLAIENTTNPNSWDSFSGNSATVQWNSTMASGPPFLPQLMMTNTEEIRRQHSTTNISGISQLSNERILTHPVSNTYRADLVKHLMTQGFKKEDAQHALIACNMDPERALAELRERYSTYAFANGLPSSASGYQQTNHGILSHHFQNSLAPSGQQTNLTSIMPNPAVASNPLTAPSRNKLHMGSTVTNSTNPMVGMTNPNPQLMRQQITQQVRSALNMSLPNQLNGPVGNSSSIVTAGNSLLGQPPPPLLNGTGHSVSISSNTPANFLSSQMRSPPGTNGNLPAFPLNTSGTKRSPRQMAIISAMQELQKKYQSIQQQVIVYRNNPAMCSQPQYTEVFDELHGQMQQIEAQLKAKQAQLNIAYAQDCAAGSSSARIVQQSLADVSSVSGLNPNNPMPSFPQNRVHNNNNSNNDQLVQQLMELRLRSIASGNTTGSENDFPAIGTWTPHGKNSLDSQDKISSQDSGVAGLRSMTALRTGNLKGQQQFTNWNGNWQSNATRPNFNNTSNWSANMGGPRALDGAGHLNGLKSTTHVPVNGMVDQQQQHQQSNCLWIMVQPLVSSGIPANINTLHSLLSSYGLTYFHVINPSTATVVVRLQSSEHAFQLIRTLGDRLSIEPITEPDTISQLHQRSLGVRTDNGTPNQFSPSGDTISNCNWMNADQFMPVSNTNTSFAAKKTNSRQGVIASGIH